MRVVILVPRRDDLGKRDEIWYDFCKPRWQAEHPGWPIVEGFHLDGLFNRSAAVNAAAKKAGSWDVAVIIDSDVLLDPHLVVQGVDIAARTGAMVLPHGVRQDLSEEATEALLTGTEFVGRRHLRVDRVYRARRGVGPGGDGLVSSVVIVPRKLWDEVGGFDEAFRGWGAEDDAFYAACRTFGSVERIASGEVVHLWHPKAAAQGKHSASYAANRARGERYRRAMGDRAAVRAIQAEVPLILAHAENPSIGIPRILHRVVPISTPPRVEAWWAEFEQMHPGWRLVTHRDPLDPADWPLTAPHWDKVTSGAQFADLIRLEAVYRDGGVYVDSDCQPFRSLEPLTRGSAFAAWEDERTVPNAVFGATKGHPAIRACLDEMILRLDEETRRTDAARTWHCGPGVFTEMLPGRDDVLLLPPGSFYAVHYDDPDRDRKMSDRKLSGRHPWAFLLHHYAGSWLADSRLREVV